MDQLAKLSLGCACARSCSTTDAGTSGIVARWAWILPVDATDVLQRRTLQCKQVQCPVSRVAKHTLELRLCVRGAGASVEGAITHKVAKRVHGCVCPRSWFAHGWLYAHGLHIVVIWIRAMHVVMVDTWNLLDRFCLVPRPPHGRVRQGPVDVMARCAPGRSVRGCQKAFLGLRRGVLDACSGASPWTRCE